MLKPPQTPSPECEAFRRRYERGITDPHLESCAACRRFAAFVDSLARVGYRAPLEDELRARLRDVPAAAGGAPQPLPRLPQLPLPPSLAVRLRRIARRGAARPVPIWIRSPRYAIAASYLLTLLIAGTLGNPAAFATETASHIDRFGVVIQSVEARSRETVGGLGEHLVEGYAVGKELVRASRSSLVTRCRELVERYVQQETTDEQAGESGPASS